jgi:sugar phosphate isomerase/epimerase
MYICLNGGTTGGSLPYEEFVKLAADAGFAGADVDLRWARSAGALRDLFAAHGLRFGGWGLPYDWRAAQWEDGLSELRRQAAIASELGIDSCATWIMPSSPLPFMENWTFHVQRLRPAATILGDRGLRLGLEFVSPFHLRTHFKHEFIFTPGQMLELADAVGPNAGLLIDSFHTHASGTDVAWLATLPASKIVLVHLNDAPAGPLHTIQDGKRLLPGEGAFDLPGFLAAIRRAGYNGPVSLEVFSQSLTQLTPAEAAKKAWAATVRCLEGVALE